MDHNSKDIDAMFKQLEEELTEVTPETQKSIDYYTRTLNFLQQGILANISNKNALALQDKLEQIKQEDPEDPRKIELADSVFFRYRASHVIYWLSIYVQLPIQTQRILQTALVSSLLTVPRQIYNAFTVTLETEDIPDHESQIETPEAYLRAFVSASPYANMRSDIDIAFWDLVVDTIQKQSEDENYDTNAEFMALVAVSSPRVGDKIISVSDALAVLCDLLMSLCHMFTNESFEFIVQSHMDDLRDFIVDGVIERDLGVSEEEEND